MNQEIQHLRNQLEQAQSPNQAKEILRLLSLVEEQYKRELLKQQSQQSNQSQKSRQEKLQEKKLLKEQLEKELKKLNEFSSGAIDWIKQKSLFYPTWHGYVNKQHIFVLEQKLTKYELKMVDRDKFSSSFSEIQNQAERIVEKYVKNMDNYLLEINKREMIVVLPTKLQEKISTKPEAGMGYHIVTIVTNEGQKYPGTVVLNGTIVKLPKRVILTSDQITDIE